MNDSFSVTHAAWDSKVVNLGPACFWRYLLIHNFSLILICVFLFFQKVSFSWVINGVPEGSFPNRNFNRLAPKLVARSTRPNWSDERYVTAQQFTKHSLAWTIDTRPQRIWHGGRRLSVCGGLIDTEDHTLYDHRFPRYTDFENSQPWQSYVDTVDSRLILFFLSFGIYKTRIWNSEFDPFFQK